MSFWDIQFGDTDRISKRMQVFGADERAKLFNVLKDFMDKRNQHVQMFLDRVPIDIAPDYRSIIPAEMYFNLIKERIGYGYYRSQEVSLLHADR